MGEVELLEQHQFGDAVRDTARQTAEKKKSRKKTEPDCAEC
jgi:hypothetical protein